MRLSTPQLSHPLFCLLLCWLATGAVLANDLPQVQQRRRVVPWAPVYALDPAASRHNAEPHQTGVFNDETIQSAGYARHYRMIIPENYDSGRPIGVLFGFQGIGEPNTGWLWTTGFEDLATEAYWITVSLALKEPGGWDSGNFDETANADLRTVQDILTRLRQLYAIDEDRLYAAGFSSGANFCQTLVTAWPTRWAAINPNMGVTEVAPRAGATFACIAAGGLLDADWHSVEHNRLLYEKYRAQGLEIECHEFRVDHHWPPPDESTQPPRLWTRAVADFFLAHPRRPQAHPCPAALRQASFRDEFNTAGGFSNAWRPERFDETGVFFPLNDCNIHPDGGVLRAHTCDEGHHGLFCFSGFAPRPVTWSIDFSIESPGAELELYPAVLRELGGRVLALCLREDGWSWRLAESATAFRARDDARIQTLAQGPLKLTPGQACRLELRDDNRPHWTLSGLGGAGQTANAILAQGEPPVTGFGPEGAQFGLGLRGRRSVVAFDNATLTQPDQADNPAMLDATLINYFSAITPF